MIKISELNASLKSAIDSADIEALKNLFSMAEKIINGQMAIDNEGLVPVDYFYLGYYTAQASKIIESQEIKKR